MLSHAVMIKNNLPLLHRKTKPELGRTLNFEYPVNSDHQQVHNIASQIRNFNVTSKIPTTHHSYRSSVLFTWTTVMSSNRSPPHNTLLYSELPSEFHQN
jgi:hypothetical protein